MKWSELKERYVGNPIYKEAFEQSELNAALGQMIRKLRKQHGMSQAKLAELMGSSTTAITRLEMGGCEPRISTLKRVADVFGMDVSVTFTPTPEGQNGLVS